MYTLLLIYGIIVVVDILLQGSDSLSSFGEVLKGFRNLKGMSQRELGEKVGLHFTYINKIEKGAMNPPSEEKLLLMEKVLNVPNYELVIWAGKIPTAFKDLILDDLDIQFYLQEKLKEKEE